jgi:hypothetical protein
MMVKKCVEFSCAEVADRHLRIPTIIFKILVLLQPKRIRILILPKCNFLSELFKYDLLLKHGLKGSFMK